jgi:uncharacterized protein (DUF2141 family)
MTRTIRTALLFLAATAPLAQAADLTIRIDNVQAGEGQLMVALYDGAAGFLKRPARSMNVPAHAGSTTLVVPDLAPGDYALAVYHDANGNGRMDANPMGIPLEPIAFGNDAQGHMGPPAFDAARLALPAAGLATRVTLR